MQWRLTVSKQLKRKDVVEYFANLEPYVIGIEAGGSAHHWARQLKRLSHEVKLIAPQFVKPYVKANKHDVADAETVILP
jgi:transposase